MSCQMTSMEQGCNSGVNRLHEATNAAISKRLAPLSNMHRVGWALFALLASRAPPCPHSFALVPSMGIVHVVPNATLTRFSAFEWAA